MSGLGVGLISIGSAQSLTMPDKCLTIEEEKQILEGFIKLKSIAYATAPIIQLAGVLVNI